MICQCVREEGSVISAKLSINEVNMTQCINQFHHFPCQLCVLCLLQFFRLAEGSECGDEGEVS